MSMNWEGLGNEGLEEDEEYGSGVSQSAKKANNPNGRRGVVKCVPCRQAKREVNSINSPN
jgi:hypothetical protein